MRAGQQQDQAPKQRAETLGRRLEETEFNHVASDSMAKLQQTPWMPSALERPG